MALDLYKCRQCGTQLAQPVLKLDDMPLAGAFVSPEHLDEADAKFPISVHACDNCGLVQLEESIPPDTLFRNYSFSTGTISPLVRHFSEYALWMIKNLKPRGVLEFGCNDGTLMGFLRDFGVRVIGVDAARNIVEIARQKSLKIYNSYFTTDLTEEILANFGPVDIVTGSNCFAHNADPTAILDAAKSVLSDNGVFIVEVMYAGDLLSQTQWDTLYHEHLTVFSLASISWLLKAHGWTVVDVVHLPMHSGSIRVVASPRANAICSAAVEDMLKAEERMALNRAASWVRFGEQSRRQIDLVGDVLKSLSASHRIWAYGASGRATMWMNACDLGFIEKIVDSSPLRANHFVPGVRTPIVYPDEMQISPPDYTFISAWNYADDICTKENWYKGRWVTPLPDLRIW
jgi:novobiocin biosynthesis protein NovU/D-mycarose 3-C-methyltransferase